MPDTITETYKNVYELERERHYNNMMIVKELLADTPNDIDLQSLYCYYKGEYDRYTDVIANL